MCVSVIVPVYKVEPYLRRCIGSVLGQTYVDWELILIDDGSPDGCPVICDEYAARDSRIRVVHQENRGLSAARNRGLDMAVGEYVMLLDSDDYLHPHALETMVRLCADEEADMVQCGYVRGTSEVFPAIEEQTAYRCFDGYGIFSSPMQQVILCAKLYRRTLWEGIRMPVGKIHEDEFTAWKLYYRSRRIVVTTTPYYYYYKNPHGIMGSEARRFSPVFVEAYDERITFFRERGEEELAVLSSWRFCLPLMYLYLRGDVTRGEERRLRCLLREHIGVFVHCRAVPWTHRAVFTFIGCCPRLFRSLSMLVGKAHTLD